MSGQGLSNQALNATSNPGVAAWVSLMGAHAAMTRAFNAELQANHGMTVMDFEALRRLDRAEGGEMRRVDLAQAVGLTPSGITRLLEGLEKAGLVGRRFCESDARVSYAVITAQGRVALGRAADEHLAALMALLDERYTGDEVAQLAALLARLPGGGEEPQCPTAAGEPPPA